MTALPGALLLVTDRRLCPRPLVDVARESIGAGLKWIWLRDRDLDPRERRGLAWALRDATAGRAALTIGADVDLALELGAGVHMPAGGDVSTARQILGPHALIGVSAHSLEDARAARDAGASYVTLSPIFPSASKPGYGPALGLQTLAQAAKLGRPVLALGGVTPANASNCHGAGAAGLAVMGGVVATLDPARATRDYLRAWDAAAVAANRAG